MTDDGRIDELIALAALGELDDAGERELDAIAQRDPAVREELERALAAAAAIQTDLVASPPDSIRAAVLDAIASTPQEAAIAPVVPLAVPRRRRLVPLLAVAAAAVALLLAGAVVLRDQRGGPTDDVVAVVEAPDAVTRVLTGELGVELLVTSSAAEAALVVEGEGVPTLDASSTYQLWVIGADGPVSAGIFRPDASGVVLQRFDDVVPGDATLGVTAEPAGGSDTPTLPILASA
jgi:anti-sigma-K factor RskA